jgi:hypothetical protein
MTLVTRRSVPSYLGLAVERNRASALGGGTARRDNGGGGELWRRAPSTRHRV